MTSVYASWNGAAEVVTWRVLAATDEQHLTSVLAARKTGFETRIDVQGTHAFGAVEARDTSGNPFNTSPTVPVA